MQKQNHPTQTPDPVIPSRALKSPVHLRQWLFDHDEAFIGGCVELTRVVEQLRKLRRKPRLSDLLRLVPMPRSQERPAEISWRELAPNPSAKRTRTVRREGWMACLRLLKRWSTNDGFNWSELVQRV
jgi:hypothetical protein